MGAHGSECSGKVAGILLDLGELGEAQRPHLQILGLAGALLCVAQATHRNRQIASAAFRDPGDEVGEHPLAGCGGVRDGRRGQDGVGIVDPIEAGQRQSPQQLGSGDPGRLHVAHQLGGLRHRPDDVGEPAGEQVEYAEVVERVRLLGAPAAAGEGVDRLLEQRAQLVGLGGDVRGGGHEHRAEPHRCVRNERLVAGGPAETYGGCSMVRRRVEQTQVVPESAQHQVGAPERERGPTGEHRKGFERRSEQLAGVFANFDGRRNLDDDGLCFALTVTERHRHGAGCNGFGPSGLGIPGRLLERERQQYVDLRGAVLDGGRQGRDRAPRGVSAAHEGERCLG